jgi:acid phosphatase type 7
MSPVASSIAESPSPSPSAVSSPDSQTVATLMAAGDIAGCDQEQDSAVASLIADREGTVATLGDNVYPSGSDETYANCYDPAWGGFRDRTRPALGNHDIESDGGAAYFRYFGAAAGTAGEGWYGYDLGSWHVVVLNSNCGSVGCDAGSTQHGWLVTDLAASDTDCTLAYWHHPRFSSGPHGDDASVSALWRALDDADADLVLVGHDHLYERFAPQNADGVSDPQGVRQITAGTGGAGLYAAERTAANSELSLDDAFGVVVLTLRTDSYDWSFVTTDGSVADSGSAECV